MTHEDSSTAPDVGTVVREAKPVRDLLERTIFALPGRDTVTAADCTGLSARLRGLAKVFDRHARVRDAAPATAAAEAREQPRVWTYPGQQR